METIISGREDSGRSGEALGSTANDEQQARVAHPDVPPTHEANRLEEGAARLRAASAPARTPSTKRLSYPPLSAIIAHPQQKSAQPARTPQQPPRADAGQSHTPFSSPMVQAELELQRTVRERLASRSEASHTAPLDSSQVGASSPPKQMSSRERDRYTGSRDEEAPTRERGLVPRDRSSAEESGRVDESAQRRLNVRERLAQAELILPHVSSTLASTLASACVGHGSQLPAATASWPTVAAHGGEEPSPRDEPDVQAVSEPAPAEEASVQTAGEEQKVVVGAREVQEVLEGVAVVVRAEAVAIARAEAAAKAEAEARARAAREAKSAVEAKAAAEAEAKAREALEQKIREMEAEHKQELMESAGAIHAQHQEAMHALRDRHAGELRELRTEQRRELHPAVPPASAATVSQESCSTGGDPATSTGARPVSPASLSTSSSRSSGRRRRVRVAIGNPRDDGSDTEGGPSLWI